MKRTILLAAVAAAFATGSAQDLSTEITVDRIVVPELRGANRLSVAPSILAPSGLTADITAAEYMGPGSVSNMLYTLAPAPWRMSTGRTPCRGYAGASIFPGFNAAVDAGYRFVDNATTTAGAWLNYDGADYKHDDTSVKRHIGTLGAYASQVIGDAGRLSIEATGMLGAVTDVGDDTRTNGAVEGRAVWEGKVFGFSYDASLGGSYFRMGAPALDGAPNEALKQGVLTFGAGGGACHSGESWRWVGMDIDGTVLKTKGMGMTLGQYHFTPYVGFGASDFRMRLGAKVSVGSGKDRHATRVAPAVMLAYAPERSRIGAEVAFAGGETLNSMLGIFECDPFAMPVSDYGRTNIPVNVTGSLHFGRFAGFGMEIHAAFASTRNLLLPAGDGYYRGCNAETWKAGADISYAFRTLFIIGAGADVAGSNNDEGCVTWYQWSDRAKAETRAYVHATPLEKLDVNLDYTWRHRRRLSCESLGAVRSLDLSAAYRITPSLTANLSLSNLLNHRCLLTCGLPSQGLHGLVGIAYKF